MEREIHTIAVRVHTILMLKKILGTREVELSVPEGSTLEGLLDLMTKRWGDDLASQLREPKGKALFPYIRIMVNGRDIAFLNRMDTVLQDGDEVLILPPVSGG